ncbi:hypothetical protein Q4485_09835 [Granulosicoccaceae sp. 1_MG-2023]|nr:hypothetical protein [Granulosicoccaceae sp. 1_MG-2023]
MGKALVHIGTGKTGTSSIQSALFEMERRGGACFKYPIVHGKGHQSLEILFKKYQRVSRGVRSKLDKAGSYDELKKTYESVLSRCFDGDVLLSSELLFSFNLEEVKIFRSYLEMQGVDDFKVVVYLRHPASYYLSLVQQKVKAAYKIPSPLSFKAGYGKKLSNWLAVFGEDVCVRRFDRSLMAGGNVLQDFSVLLSDFFNADVSLAGGSVNESVSAEGMVVLQEFRKYFFLDQEDRFSKKSNMLLKKIQNLESEFPGSKPVLKSVYSRSVSNLNMDYLSILSDFNLLMSSEVDSGAWATMEGGDEVNFSGNVKDLLQDFDEDHYKFLLHKIAYDLI